LPGVERQHPRTSRGYRCERCERLSGERYR
jgi:hypothetical protein